MHTTGKLQLGCNFYFSLFIPPQARQTSLVFERLLANTWSHHRRKSRWDPSLLQRNRSQEPGLVDLGGMLSSFKTTLHPSAQLPHEVLQPVEVQPQQSQRRQPGGRQSDLGWFLSGRCRLRRFPLQVCFLWCFTIIRETKRVVFKVNVMFVTTIKIQWLLRHFTRSSSSNCFSNLGTELHLRNISNNFPNIYSLSSLQFRNILHVFDWVSMKNKDHVWSWYKTTNLLNLLISSCPNYSCVIFRVLVTLTTRGTGRRGTVASGWKSHAPSHHTSLGCQVGSAPLPSQSRSPHQDEAIMLPNLTLTSQILSFYLLPVWRKMFSLVSSPCVLLRSHFT